jgi:peptidoglycan/LPS O-acetylase OafA/YrhL
MSISLSRRTSTGQYIREIDGLRFFAIMPVVIWHLAVRLGDLHPESTVGPLYSWLAIGAKGVQIFFIISGFILLLPYAQYYNGIRDRPSTRPFYLRRITRLEPPYLIAVIVIGSAQFLRGVDHIGRFFAGLGYSHALFFGDTNPFFSIAWTLEIEIQFYLLVPIIAKVFLLRDPIARRAIVVSFIVLLSSADISLFNAPSHLNLFGHLPWFGVGILLVDCYINDWQSPSTRTTVWSSVSAISAIMLIIVFRFGLPGMESTLDTVVPPLLGFLVFAGVFRSPRVGRAVTWGPLPIIGGMAYSIYLLHDAAIAMVQFVYTGNSSLAIAISITVIPICILVITLSGIFFVLIERPCMDPLWPTHLCRWLRESLLRR